MLVRLSRSKFRCQWKFPGVLFSKVFYDVHETEKAHNRFFLHSCEKITCSTEYGFYSNHSMTILWLNTYCTSSGSDHQSGEGAKLRWTSQMRVWGRRRKKLQIFTVYRQSFRNFCMAKERGEVSAPFVPPLITLCRSACSLLTNRRTVNDYRYYLD